MSEEEIRDYIFTKLARLYEDPLHRNQYKRFTFEPADRELARKVLTRLTRNFVIEQVQPDVVRLTDLGYQLIQPDLKKATIKKSSEKTEAEKETRKKIQPPAPEEIEALFRKLDDPDYISASHFSEGESEIYWATKGFEEVTGYSLEELKKAGGSIALIGAESQHKVEQVARELLERNEVMDELDIVTKNGRKRTIRFIARAQYDSRGRVTGTISAVKDVTREDD